MDSTKAIKTITTRARKPAVLKSAIQRDTSLPQSQPPNITAVYNQSPVIMNREPTIVKRDIALDHDIIRLEQLVQKDPTDLKALKMLLQFKTFRENWETTKEYLNEQK